MPTLLVALALTGAAWAAAPDANLGPMPPPRQQSKGPNDIMVPIPGWAPDVKSNGCHVRTSPDEALQPGLRVPFRGLIDRAAGRHSVRIVVDPPETYFKKVAALDDDMRRLVLLHTLHESFGRDGLHTFFFMKGGAVAPAIRDALREAGLTREHDIVVRAMALFGATYPTDEKEREKFFGYSQPGGNLNAFDQRLLALSRTFGSKEKLAQAIVAFVNRTPALFRRIEALRETLSDSARLRHLTDALAQKIDWSNSATDIQRRLAALPKQERSLIAIEMFNIEFENGGIHQFFHNSSGDIAPEVYDAMVELGLEPQAEIFKRAMAMMKGPFIRDNDRRREAHFAGDWSEWDKTLSAMTDEFYAIGGGAQALRIKGDLAFEGGPGIRHGMLNYAREHKMLPC